MEILYWVLGVIAYIAMGQLTYVVGGMIDKRLKQDDGFHAVCSMAWPLTIIVGSVILLGKFFYNLFAGKLFKFKKGKCNSRIEALEKKLELQELKEENEKLKKEWEELGFKGEIGFMTDGSVYFNEGRNTLDLYVSLSTMTCTKQELRAIIRYLRKFGG